VYLISISVSIAQEKEAVFVDKLLAAKSQEERDQLLKSQKSLLTSELVRVLLDKGNKFQLHAEYAQGMIAFELAQSIAESLNDRSHVAEALNGIGFIHYMNGDGDFRPALEAFNKSLKLSEEIGNEKGIAQSLNNIGRVNYLSEEYEEALEFFYKSLAIRERLNDRAGVAESLGGIGLVHHMRAEDTKAVDFLKRSLALREKLQDEDALASALCNLGLAELELRNAESAESYFKKSLVLREKLGDKVGMITVLGGLGSLHDYQGNYQEALYYFEKALKLSEEIDHRFYAAWCLGVIGQVAQSLGNYRLALEYFQKSLQLREKLGERSGIAHTLNLIGNLQLNQGNYQLAREYHKKGLHQSEELKDTREIASSFRMIGESYKLEGNHEKALEYYEKSLTYAEATEDRTRIADALNDMAYVQNELGHVKVAMQTLQRSLTISQQVNYKAGSTDALRLSSSIQYDQHNYPEALDLADKAVKIARSTGSRPDLWESLSHLGKAYAATNHPDKAIESLEEAISTIETLRIELAGGEEEQQRYFQNKVIPYNVIVDLLGQQSGKEMQALAYAERAKARALLDVLQIGRATIAGAMTVEEIDRERSLKSKLISINQQIQQSKLDKTADPNKVKELTASLDSARLNMEQFRTTVYAAHPELKIQRGEAEIISSEGIEQLLQDPADALLEYVVTHEKILLFVLAKSKGEVQTQIYTINLKQRDLSSRIHNFRKLVADRNPGYRKDATYLYNLLIQPATDILHAKQNLIIVPDDVLWELPFQALISNNDRYLLEDYGVSYAPSLTVLSEMRKLKTKKANFINLFAMGNPSLGTKLTAQMKEIYRDAKLDPLPQAEREVHEIAKLYGEDQSTIYVSANALEDRVKNEAAKYNLLHFATHGIINDASPLYSQILLAQSNTQAEDGLLEAWEIMNLKLNADLVVLSACETALGKVSKGEGMIGLTWALFVAGTPTTVVSQWKVDSASTTELMIHFHKNLQSMLTKSEGGSVPDALRNAALNLLKKEEYRHPFYWAPFVVIGAGS
jgi:CHAT domain-containing protein/uncharacterized protein HemY